MNVKLKVNKNIFVEFKMENENLKKKVCNLSAVFCLHNQIAVLGEDDFCVKIGMVNEDDKPLKERLVRYVKKLSGKECFFLPIEKDKFTKTIASLFAGRKNLLTEKNNSSKENDKYDENAAKALLKSLISQAGSYDATDIHIEDERVRFRIKGKLEKEIPLDAANEYSLVQRIKLLSKMNVVEKRRGQDGQFVFTNDEGKNIFVRVSCLPAVKRSDQSFGESVVLRLLDTQRIALNIEVLGFNKRQVETIKKFCSLRDGLILICGPTGSGKSTTACSMLEEIKKLSSNTKKIISLEDPPEYVIEGVTQVQIDSTCDMNFLEVLKRTFRQDPDVIFLGEIRDGETARIAVQASLTGHLVIATLHTASISQAVIRLCDLGESPKVVHEVLRGVIVQHLEDGILEADMRYIPQDLYKKSKIRFLKNNEDVGYVCQ